MPALRLATCLAPPEVDVDEPLLLAALAERGVAARMAAWDDPAEPWDAPIATLLRSTWDYPRRPQAFLAWIDRVAAAAPLWNPAAVVRWNFDKRYLLELAGRGIATVPTERLERGAPARLAALLDARGWRRAVVKPAVSCASFGTLAVARDDVGPGEAHLAALLAERDALVQPWLPSVEDYGERSLVWIAGELTHAVRKAPRWMGEAEAVSETAVPIAPAERRLAEGILAPIAAAAGPDLLYARVDVAPDDAGRPLLMELELIEPSLFLAQHPPALARFAGAIAARLAAVAARAPASGG